MFESDGEWDIDQDFLNDVDEKASQYYSQPVPDAEDAPTKRRKIDNQNCASVSFTKQTASSNTIENKEGNGTNSNANKASRTNLILQIFQKDRPKVSEPVAKSDNLPEKLTACDTSSNPNSSHLSNKSDSLARKQLILGILKKQKDETNIKKIPQETEKNSVINLSFSTKNLNEKVVKPSSSKVQAASGEISKLVQDKKTPKPQINEASRKQLVLDTLAQYTTNKKVKNQNEIDKNQGIYKPPHNNEKVTIVRKFPGPAGLLPDKIDGSIPPSTYWNNLEEDEKKRSMERSDSKLAEFCSQNTKDLFTEGAWQFMLNDLPPDFLKGHEIATIKQKANTNHEKSTKMQFLAGIIKSIDHNHDNPIIILKDFTDTIQGVVHRDILGKYPGLLQPNVVILLRDVGMLRIPGSLFTSKYHIVVSPSSLVGIYTNKGNVMRANPLHVKAEKSMSRHLNVNRNSCSGTKTEGKDSTVTSGGLFSKEISNDDSINFDDIEDYSFPLEEVTNSQIDIKFSWPAVKKNSNLYNVSSEKKQDISESKDVKKKEALMRRLKEKKYSSSPRKSNDTLGSLNSCSVKMSTLASSLDPNQSFEIRHTNTQDNCIRNSQIDCQVNLPKTGKNIKELGKESMCNIRSKLLQFKSKEVLTPPERQDSNSNSSSTLMESNSTSFKSNTSELALCCNSNDSDDEMLSQLDVDTFT